MHQTRRYRRARRYRALQASMADTRSREVVFVPHCLLNQNTRYLSGSVCRGVVSAAVAPYLADGTGIVQMPCPEQRVWGGVIKTRMLWLIQHPRIARVAPALLPLALPYVRWHYAHHARAVARDIEDYLASGLSVRGIVGVAGSPSCGVHTTLDLKRAAEAARRPRNPATADWMNATVVEPALRPGRGLFVEELTRAMTHRGAQVPLLEQTLPTVAGSGRTHCPARMRLIPAAPLGLGRGQLGTAPQKHADQQDPDGVEQQGDASRGLDASRDVADGACADH